MRLHIVVGANFRPVELCSSITQKEQCLFVGRPHHEPARCVLRSIMSRLSNSSLFLLGEGRQFRRGFGNFTLFQFFTLQDPIASVTLSRKSIKCLLYELNELPFLSMFYRVIFLNDESIARPLCFSRKNTTCRYFKLKGYVVLVNNK